MSERVRDCAAAIHPGYSIPRQYYFDKQFWQLGASVRQNPSVLPVRPGGKKALCHSTRAITMVPMSSKEKEGGRGRTLGEKDYTNRIACFE